MADEKNPAAPSSADAKALQQENARLKAELAASQEANKSKDVALDQMKDDLAQARLGDAGNSFATTTTKPTVQFRVTPFNKKLVQLQPLEGEFVDESEAIRCFWVLNRGKFGLNQAGQPMLLDSSNVNVNVECLNPEKREANRREQYLKRGIPEALIPVA